ncbi:hypothetical protein [Arachnia propionica]|uniref:Uncharacterized protein n=1 Tax=Arachnia propionica TaxID=1750 RepID=A0A3P1WTL7_9ACTN|nr:hypothetical protein [Arachnia propionica]RRD49511.1 hypothetical protein EII35_07875 [Arachnia propionica]
MGDWIGLVVALAVGVPLLLAAVWGDVRRRRRSEGPVEDAGVGYLTASEIAAMPAPPAAARHDVEAGTLLPLGHADPGFADADGRVEFSDARILMIRGAGLTMRELMVPLSRHQPLVIVAEELDPELVDTLVANRRALHLLVVAVVTPGDAGIAELTGAEPLDVSDLKAGYVPEEALGRAATWVSDAETTRIVPAE